MALAAASILPVLLRNFDDDVELLCPFLCRRRLLLPSLSPLLLLLSLERSFFRDDDRRPLVPEDDLDRRIRRSLALSTTIGLDG